MNFSSFLAEGWIPILYAAFSILRFENQRWIRAIGQGRVGSNPVIPLLVNFTGIIGLVLAVGIPIVLLFLGDWKIAVGTLGFGVLGSVAGALLIRGDSFATWLLSTILMWPVGYLLFQHTYTAYV